MTVTGLPRGWAEATVGDLGRYVNGLAFKPSDWVETGMPIVRIQNLTDPSRPFNRTERKVEEIYVVRRGDILVSWSATLDAFLWDRKDAVLNQHIFRVIPETRLVENAFSFHLLRHTIQLMRHSADVHGSTMRHINRGPFLSFPVPLPPLPEQQRIVAEIETQFTRLDAAIAALESAQAKLKRYRASVLRSACEGGLVPTEAELARAEGRDLESADVLLECVLAERRAKWEAEQLEKMQAAGKKPKDDTWKARYKEPGPPDVAGLPTLPEGWTWARVDQVGEVKLGRQRAPQHHTGQHMRPYLRVANVFEDRLDLTDVKEMNFNPAEFETFRLREEDILLNEGQSLELVGRPAMFRGEIPGVCFQNTLVRFRCVGGVVPQYALALFRSYLHNGRFQRIARWTTNIAHLGASRFAALEFPLPPAAEQKRIVEEIERRLTTIESIETVVQAGLRRAARLRRSLLKRAFEGRLVPQDTTDEPASILLERILEERQQEIAAARPKRKPGARSKAK